jgi:peptide/nickel transport system substrate-binding protein
MSIDRRRFLKTAAGAGGVLAAPRLVHAATDDRPVLTVAVPVVSNTGTLEPLREQNNTAWRVLGSIMEPLIDLDRQGDLSLQPGLAESWKRVDPRTLDLTLRKGVRFHNGAELTAEDVVFSFGPERMFGDTTTRPQAKAPPEVAATGRRIWGNLESVKATGSHSVRFVTKVPDLALEGGLTRLGAEIISKRAYLEAKDWKEWSQRPIGTGPYKIKEFRRDTVLVLAAHDDYWGGRPPVREVRFTVVPETASRINGLISGLYDIVADIPPDQLGVINKAAGYEAVGGPVTQILTLAFDAHHPALKDPRVRQALTHAIDRKLIVDSLWDGKAVVPRGLQYDFYGDMLIRDWTPPAYDPALAKKLLSQTAYKGEPIPYRINNNYYPNQVATAQVLVEMWRAVGLNVNIVMKENPSVVIAPGPDRAIREWSNAGAFGDPVSALVFQMGPVGVLQHGKEWSNDEFNRLCAELETGTDPVKRKAVHRRMLEIIEREDPAYTVLHQLSLFYGKRKGLRWTPSHMLSMDFRARNLAVRA